MLACVQRVVDVLLHTLRICQQWRREAAVQTIQPRTIWQRKCGCYCQRNSGQHVYKEGFEVRTYAVSNGLPQMHPPGFMSFGSTAGTMRALGMMAARTLPRAAWILHGRGAAGSSGALFRLLCNCTRHTSS